LFVALDIVGSSLGLLIFSLLQIPTPLGIWYLLMISIPGMLAFGLKVWYAFKGYGKADPLSYARRQFGANFVALAVSGSAVSWIAINPAWYRIFNFTGAEVIISAFSVLFGPYILYQIVTGAQNLWWQTQALVEEVPNEETIALKKKTLKDLKGTISKTALYGIGSVVYMAVIPVSVDVLQLVEYTGFSYRILPVLIVSLSLILPIIGVYYIYRRLFITKRGATSSVGRRTRAEALVDIVPSAISAFMMFSVFWWFTRPHYIQSVMYEWMLDYSELGALLILASEIVSILLMAGALWIRVGADVIRLTNRRYVSSIRWLSTANGLLIVGLSLFFPFVYVDMSAQFINMNFFYVFLWLSTVMVLGFQMALCQKQLEVRHAPKKPIKTNAKVISHEDWKKNM
jgi:hypothetical protein